MRMYKKLFFTSNKMSVFDSDLESMDLMIESIPETVCDIEILKFEPFESDLENAIIDSTADKIMNGAFSDRDCITVTANTIFILVSWDVGRPGLWYGV
jgi:hypothetical protein